VALLLALASYIRVIEPISVQSRPLCRAPSTGLSRSMQNGSSGIPKTCCKVLFRLVSGLLRPKMEHFKYPLEND